MKFLHLTVAFAFMMPLLPCKGFGQPPRHIQFSPANYYRKFSSKIAPVLRIQPGDTVSTESLDAAGNDKHGEIKAERGNPLTGPFYIEGAQPGDLLVIRILKVTLNRDKAYTVEGFVPRGMDMDKEMKDTMYRKAKLAQWNLDHNSMTAKPANVHEHLQNFRVPIKPMLGCVGIAPAGSQEILTYFNGPFGGNMDFSRVTAGAIVYLPVNHDGALLLMGDGHAAQGDAELSGDGLETSMDFSFTTALVKNGASALNFPHIEDSTYIMIPGMAKSFDDALLQANARMFTWLREKYQLSAAEISAVMNTSVEYKIAELPDPEVEIFALLKWEILAPIKK